MQTERGVEQVYNNYKYVIMPQLSDLFIGNGNTFSHWRDQKNVQCLNVIPVEGTTYTYIIQKYRTHESNNLIGIQITTWLNVSVQTFRP